GGEAIEEKREGSDAAFGLLPVEELVGRVVAVFGQGQAEEDDRGAEQVLHSRYGADRASFAREDRLGAEAETVGVPHCIGERAIGATFERLEAAIRVDLDIREALGDERLDPLEGGRTGHVGDQSTGGFYFGPRWDGRLHARTGVAADHAVHFKGRL